MPTVDFSFRLIFDEDFYEKIIKRNPNILRKLMYINSRAQGNKRTFNILPKSIFNLILTNNSSMSRELLRTSFYDLEVEELESIEDNIEKVIKYAVHIVEENPKKKSMILTSEDNEIKYSTNPHFINARDVVVKSDTDALAIIEDFWEECTEK